MEHCIYSYNIRILNLKKSKQLFSLSVVLSEERSCYVCGPLSTFTNISKHKQQFVFGLTELSIHILSRK